MRNTRVENNTVNPHVDVPVIYMTTIKKRRYKNDGIF